MVKPRTKTSIKFPYFFEKNGRTGRIKKWADDKFGTYFIFAGEKKRNSFRTFEAAFEYLDREFSKLDTDRANSLSLHPLNNDIRTYSELEGVLREQAPGATLRDAVTFYVAHHRNKKLEPQRVKDCAASFIKHQRANNISQSQVETLAKHFRRFEIKFGSRVIHEITTKEITEWLMSRIDEKTGQPWSAKTRTSNLGSLVSLSLYARDILNAIPDIGKTQFQKVRRPKKEQPDEVEIYTVEEMEKLLLTALKTDLDLIPAFVLGGFQGLRPAEFHGEGTDRRPLSWESLNWADKKLHVTGQKVRSKATRDLKIHSVSQAWLAPFEGLIGEIWKHKEAYTKKMLALRERAKVQSIYDGFRHSFASYRIRQLDGDLNKLAEEMGNSPREIINSYKRNVTDEEAEKWFGLMPPVDYSGKVRAALKLNALSDL